MGFEFFRIWTMTISDLRFPSPESLGDFYSYDVVNLGWKGLATTGLAPGIRSEMGMVAAAGRVFVFGGSASSGKRGKTQQIVMFQSSHRGGVMLNFEGGIMSFAGD